MQENTLEKNGREPMTDEQECDRQGADYLQTTRVCWTPFLVH